MIMKLIHGVLTHGKQQVTKCQVSISLAGKQPQTEHPRSKVVDLAVHLICAQTSHLTDADWRETIASSATLSFKNEVERPNG